MVAKRARDRAAYPVTVLGAGLMGAPIASLFLGRGYPVTISTSSATGPVQAMRRVTRHLPPASRDRAEGRLSWRSRTTDACLNSYVVFESLPEDAELKSTELGKAQEAAPEAILATNTSSLSLDDLGSKLADPSLLLGAHFLYPPTQFNVMEVVPSTATSAGALETAISILIDVGLTPIRLKREIPGFLINRLQFAVLREALHLVGSGVADPDDIDLLISRGLAPRWVGAGPLATATIGGGELFDLLARRLVPELSNDSRPPLSFAEVAVPGNVDSLRRTRHRIVDEVLRAVARTDAVIPARHQDPDSHSSSTNVNSPTRPDKE